jgi:hypothetical protein
MAGVRATAAARFLFSPEGYIQTHIRKEEEALSPGVKRPKSEAEHTYLAPKSRSMYLYHQHTIRLGIVLN